MNVQASTKCLRCWLIAGLVFFGFLFLIRSILLPFVIGALAAYFLDPAADKLERWGTSRLLATLLITSAFFLIIIVVCLLLVPLVFDQLSGLIAAIPEYVSEFDVRYGGQIRDMLQHFGNGGLDSVKDTANTVSGAFLTFIGNFVTGIFQSGFVIINVLSLLLITPVVAFYLLKDWDRIVAIIDGLLPQPYAPTIRTLVAQIDHVLSGFVRGQLNVCLFLGLYYAILLSLAGLKFGLVVGLLTGMLAIIPYVGLTFGFALGLGIAFFQYDDMTMIGVIVAIFLTGQFLEGNFITPKLVGSRVGLHPVWIIFGMLAGAALFGFVGIFIAVPVTAILGVLFRHAAAEYVKSPMYLGGPPPAQKPPA